MCQTHNHTKIIIIVCFYHCNAIANSSNLLFYKLCHSIHALKREDVNNSKVNVLAEIIGASVSEPPLGGLNVAGQIGNPC